MITGHLCHGGDPFFQNGTSQIGLHSNLPSQAIQAISISLQITTAGASPTWPTSGTTTKSSESSELPRIEKSAPLIENLQPNTILTAIRAMRKRQRSSKKLPRLTKSSVIAINAHVTTNTDMQVSRELDSSLHPPTTSSKRLARCLVAGSLVIFLEQGVDAG